MLLVIFSDKKKAHPKNFHNVDDYEENYLNLKAENIQSSEVGLGHGFYVSVRSSVWVIGVDVFQKCTSFI